MGVDILGVDILGVDILGVDILGVDILGVDMLRLTRNRVTTDIHAKPLSLVTTITTSVVMHCLAMHGVTYGYQWLVHNY